MKNGKYDKCPNRKFVKDVFRYKRLNFDSSKNHRESKLKRKSRKIEIVD